jgi:predicted amidophosphoribosyltransferase
MKKKFRFEAASESEAAFIFCEYNPFMKSKIIQFRTHNDMDNYKTENLTIQVRRQLPIILEVIEVDSTDQKLIDINLKRMAEWYYYVHIKGI